MYVPESQQCNGPNSSQPAPASEQAKQQARVALWDDMMRRARAAYEAGLVRSPADFSELGPNVMRDVANENARGSGGLAGQAAPSTVEVSGPSCAPAVEVIPLNTTPGMPERPDYGPMTTSQGLNQPPVTAPTESVPAPAKCADVPSGPPSGGAYPASYPATYPAACNAARPKMSWLWWLAAAGVVAVAASNGGRGRRTA
jgi:hypothetical protein